MEICRACLLTEQDMIALDEFCVTSYNMLTNLEINLGDNMPQVLCRNCFNMVKDFTDFREKAIISETTLRAITENTKPGHFCPEGSHTDSTNTKIEINIPDVVTDCETFDSAVFSTEVYDNDSCENDLDVKVQLLQCVLCKKEFVDKSTLLNHFKEHKRGGKCKLCFEKVKIVDLYAHTCAHLQSLAEPEHYSDANQEVKLELAGSECFVKSESVNDKKKERKSKTAKKNKVASKLSAESTVQLFLACGLCKMQFDCKELMVKHLESHKVEGNSICDICHETCSSWPQLFGHRIEHLPQKQRHCHLCTYWNNSQNAMEFHYRKKHYDGEDKFLKCKHCLRSYSTPRKLAKHLNCSHVQRRYICDYCSKCLTTRNGLRIHIASHDQTRPFVCDLCGFSSKLKSGLRNHKLRRHDPRKIVCKLCDLVFVDQAKFDQHNCNHSSAICPECGKEFRAKKLLTRHLRCHLAGRPYVCARCPASYRSRGALRVHSDRHDGNRTKRCDHCGARFYTTAVLVKHRRVHTGEKPFVCKICQRGFTGKHNLKVHMRIHGEDLIVKKDKTSLEPSLFTYTK